MQLSRSRARGKGWPRRRLAAAFAAMLVARSFAAAAADDEDEEASGETDETESSEEGSDADETGSDEPGAGEAEADGGAAGDTAETESAETAAEATATVALPDPAAIEDTATYDFAAEFSTYVDSDHVTVFTPSVAAGVQNASGASARASYLVDVVSAASVDIVSTASPRWEEVRHEGSLALDYAPGDIGGGIGGSVSYEPDYLAFGGFGRLKADFDQKNWSLFVGAGFSKDTLRRCGGTLNQCSSYAVFSRDVYRGSFSGGAELVINPSSVASLTFDAILESGDQSKPYRYIPMFSPTVAPTVPRGASVDWVNANRLPERPQEQLPLTRKRYAATARYDVRFSGSTLRVFERGYYDTWGLVASTTDLRFVIDLGQRFAVWPHARLHVQNGANFWRRAYVSGTGWDLPLYRTGDRELGPLLGGQGGLGFRWYLGGAAAPDHFSLTLAGDALYTSFSDTLYVTSRKAVLSSLTFEGAL